MGNRFFDGHILVQEALPGDILPRMSRHKVAFLGTGDAFSPQGRHQAGYLVRNEETCFLLDCGATTLTALKRSAMPASEIDTVFISHLHGDHFGGLPFLFLEYTYSEPRNRPLRIAGPPGTEQRVYQLFKTMYSDVGSRPLPFEVQFIELLPQKQVQVGPLNVHPFRVPHQENEISLGMSVQTGGRKILYSGDTGWTETLVEHSRDVDLFICECCYFETRMDSHLDYPRLAENRGRFGSKRLILSHLGREVLDRRKEIEIELATEGLTVDV
jgi:ribonuclease BN (tRNA processing enzyme)